MADPTTIATEALELADALPPAPWEEVGISDGDKNYRCGVIGLVNNEEFILAQADYGKGDCLPGHISSQVMEFIAFSREALPTLARALLEAEQRIAKQREEIERLTKERDEARAIVAGANNSLHGSEGYFTNPPLWPAIEDLKQNYRETWRRAERLQVGYDTASFMWQEAESQSATLSQRVAELEGELRAIARLADKIRHEPSVKIDVLRDVLGNLEKIALATLSNTHNTGEKNG